MCHLITKAFNYFGFYFISTYRSDLYALSLQNKQKATENKPQKKKRKLVRY